MGCFCSVGRQPAGRFTVTVDLGPDHDVAEAESQPIPHARQEAFMALDSTCGIVVLYGGDISTQTSFTVYYDTWAWNGQTWTKVG